MTQFNDQIKIKLISQLIKSILRVLQKLPRYLNDKAIFISTVLSSSILFLNLDLILIDLESVMFSSG